MTRVTITLSEPRLRAFEALAARRGITVAALIEERLEELEVLNDESVERLVERARDEASMTEDEAMALAVRETRAARRK